VARRCVWSRNLENEEAKPRYRAVKIPPRWVVTPRKQIKLKYTRFTASDLRTVSLWWIPTSIGIFICGWMIDFIDLDWLADACTETPAMITDNYDFQATKNKQRWTILICFEFLGTIYRIFNIQSQPLSSRIEQGPFGILSRTSNYSTSNLSSFCSATIHHCKSTDFVVFPLRLIFIDPRSGLTMSIIHASVNKC